MKILIVDFDGNIIQGDKNALDEITIKSILKTALAARKIAKAVKDELRYIKLNMKDNAIVLGFEDAHIVINIAETPVEVAEAIDRFSK